MKGMTYRLEARPAALLVAVALLLVAATALYAANLWLVGVETLTVSEGGGAAQPGHMPVPAALAALLASLCVGVGILARWPRLAWAGATFLVLMGALWIFSIGVLFLLSGLLFMALLLALRRFS